MHVLYDWLDKIFNVVIVIIVFIQNMPMMIIMLGHLIDALNANRLDKRNNSLNYTLRDLTFNLKTINHLKLNITIHQTLVIILN